MSALSTTTPFGLPPANSLRGRAIDAAMRLLERKGAEAVNVRAIAAELETGPASLYYHFANKDALLAELAATGFRMLRAAFTAAARDSQGRDALLACGEGYVAFVREHTTLYAFMYNERLLAHPVVRGAEQRAFDAFVTALRASPRLNPNEPDEALGLWVLVRGIGALFVALAPPRDQLGDDEFAYRIVRGLKSVMQRPIRHPLAGA